MEHLDIAPCAFLDSAFEELTGLEQEPELPYYALSEPIKFLSGPGLTKEIQALLMLFKTSKGKPLKKEYVRISIIRRHKKEMRKFLSKPKKPNKTCATIDSAIPEWEKFVRHLETNASVLQEVSLTEAGPKTEARTKREKRLIQTEKSHNNTFCIRYFSSDPTKESFYYFIDYLFADLNSENLCVKLKIQCCQSQTHSEMCTELWLKLKDFFQFWMIRDVNLAGFGFQAVQDFYGLNEIDNLDEFLNLE